MLLLPYISHTRVRSTNTTIYKPAFQIIVVSITYPLNNAILTVDKVDLHYNTPSSLLSVSIVVGGAVAVGSSVSVYTCHCL